MYIYVFRVGGWLLDNPSRARQPIGARRVPWKSTFQKFPFRAPARLGGFGRFQKNQPLCRASLFGYWRVGSGIPLPCKAILICEEG